MDWRGIERAVPAFGGVMLVLPVYAFIKIYGRITRGVLKKPRALWLYASLIGMLSFQIYGCAPAAIVGGPIGKNFLKDGTYEGSAKEGPVKVVAKVTVKKQSITEIEILKHRTWKGKAAERVIPDRIIDEQSTNVDAVSGATISSRVIMNADEAAIRKAK